jgi:nicotinamidase-related amidase
MSALIVIDLQKGILAMPCAHPVTGVLQHARDLAAGFRRKGLPVVLVNVAGGAPGRSEQGRSLAGLPPDFADLAEELDRQPQDHTVTKRTWGAFTGTGLEQHLKGLGVTQVVLAGVATGIGVESTARQAHECGFNVTLALDAMTDRSLEVHRNSVERIFPRLGETGSSAEILALLEREA